MIIKAEGVEIIMTEKEGREMDDGWSA